MQSHQNMETNKPFLCNFRTYKDYSGVVLVFINTYCSITKKKPTKLEGC